MVVVVSLIQDHVQDGVLGRGLTPLPTGYDWHVDALVSQSR